MRNLFLLLVLLSSLRIQAFPKKLEFVFLSKQSTTVFNYLDQQIEFFSSVAQNFDCVPMGDGCFHPQLGFLDKRMPIKKKNAKKEVELRTINSEKTSLIECDENNYFDVFCGKSQAEVGPVSDLEVWIDTSSSMRNMDWNKDPSRCYRRSFVEKIKKDCGNVLISTYNTSRKEIGSHANACLNYGLNDVTRLIDWIKGSDSKHLVVITDIDEFSRELRDFVEQEGAIVHGAEVKPFKAEDLLKIIPKLAKSSCKKK